MTDMNASPHIGLLVPDLNQRHGWATYSLSLIQALQKAGLRLTIVAAKNSPEVAGLTIHRLLPNVTPAERFLLLKQALALPTVKNLLRDCDVIHALIEPYAPLGAWLVGKRPFLVTAHGSYVRLPEERRWPANTIYRRAFQRSLLVCVSHYTARVAAQILPTVKTEVVNNGVDVGRFAGIGADKTEHQSEKTLVVLSVGAVKKRKGTLELVRAMPDMRRSFPGVQCIIIGRLDAEPAYVERVQAEIERLKVADCVRLLGHVPEAVLFDWYARADVFVIPSVNDGKRFEGYGLAYLEAGAAGLPVIGTTDNGGEDAIEDGITGLLVPQDAIAEKLPEAINQLLSDAALRARMGEAGRKKAALQTWDAAARQMIGLYSHASHS